MRIVSCGFGVASTAMLFVTDFDLIIHADPGYEHEWTKALQGFTRQYFDNKMITVHNNLNGIPRGFFIHPRLRRCTGRFKIQPMRKHMRKIGLKKVIMFIGYTVDEKHRIRESNVKWVQFEYPLIEQGLTRSDCRRILKKKFPFYIMHSGCVDCFSSTIMEQHMPLTKYLAIS